MDASVLIWGPLALLFFSAIINGIVKQRTRDLCLKEFHGDLVVIRMKDGEIIHGILAVFPDCLEIQFIESQALLAGFERQTYVLFKQRFDQIYCIYRLAPVQDTSRHTEWLREIQNLRSPSLGRRLLRFFRNLYNVLRDAFSQSVGMLIGIAKARSKTLSNLQTADARANEVTQTLLGTLPNAYEPVLETYIGSFVLLQCANGSAVKEEIGVLQDYTVQYLLVRDVVLSENLPDIFAKSILPDQTRSIDVVYPRASTWVRSRARKARV